MCDRADEVHQIVGRDGLAVEEGLVDDGSGHKPGVHGQGSGGVNQEEEGGDCHNKTGYAFIIKS